MFQMAGSDQIRFDQSVGSEVLPSTVLAMKR
jgi:hypothetical protein